MESPNKRRKTTPPSFDAQNDFVPLGEDDGNSFLPDAYSAADHVQPLRASHGPRGDREPPRGGSSRFHDPRNTQDRPKSKHLLPGYEPWILIKTKLKRRFVYNTSTKESLWRIPADVMQGVRDFDISKQNVQQKGQAGKGAEAQPRGEIGESRTKEPGKEAQNEGRSRRRRSESLQREDEEALMAELAAQAEHAEEQDAKKIVKALQPLQPHGEGPGYESDSSYEVIEVTDSEDEEDETQSKPHHNDDAAAQGGKVAEDGPVEFGEDDIAYQLAALEEDYDLDAGEYGEDPEGPILSNGDAIQLFRDLLDDHRISPFTPWGKLIADESERSILNDNRYTVLPTSRARKAAWDDWVRDKAAQLKQERAAMEKQDPRIPYLAFLHEKATPKLYWPEFKRKFKREPELNDRKLGDKDREKLYRDHINRLKLPERTRKLDLVSLLQNAPAKMLNKETSLDRLPQQILSHLHYVSLASSIRDPIIEAHIRKLPSAPEADDMTEEQRIEEDKKRAERRRREQAMAERERKVDDDRRRIERDEAKAKRGLMAEQREIQDAMSTSRRHA